jgi:outer membrane protein OmpA-like peptidoglycan-associated protein
MLRVLALLALMASPALAQERTRAIAGETVDLTLGTETLIADIENLVPGIVDIAGATRDLVLPVQEMIVVTQTAKVVKIELPADVLFDFDKAEIRPDAAVALGAAADLLRKGVNGAVKIDGHTDSKGAAAYNQKLSTDRARSVQTWFTKNGALPASLKYTLTGFGATKPRAPNAKPDGSDNPDGRQLNRRVEITFTTK